MGGSRRASKCDALRADGRALGVALEETLRREGAGSLLPRLVEECTRHVQERAPRDPLALTSDGDPSHVMALRVGFERSGEHGVQALRHAAAEAVEQASEGGGSSADVRAACSLLRTFLVELPRPLVPVDLFLPALEAARDKEHQQLAASLEEIFAPMPEAHQLLLEHLRELIPADLGRSRPAFNQPIGLDLTRLGWTSRDLM